MADEIGDKGACMGGGGGGMAEQIGEKGASMWGRGRGGGGIAEVIGDKEDKRVAGCRGRREGGGGYGGGDRWQGRQTRGWLSARAERQKRSPLYI